MSSYWMSSYWMSSSKTFWKLLCGEYIHRTTLTTVYMYHLEFYTQFSWNSLPKLCWKKCQILGVDIVKKLNNKNWWLPQIVRSRDIVMKMLGKWSHGSNWLTNTISSWKNKIKFSFPKKVWRGGYCKLGQDDVIDYTKSNFFQQSWFASRY